MVLETGLPFVIDAPIATVLAVVAVVSSMLSVLLTYRASVRKSNVDYRTALDQRIDERLSEQMSSAWEQIDKLKVRVKTLEETNSLMRLAVRGWFARLIRWDRNGRRGKMPLPTADDMKIIGIDDLAVHDETDEITTPPTHE